MGNQLISNNISQKACLIEERCLNSTNPHENSGIRTIEHMDDYFGKAIVMTRQDSNHNLLNKSSIQEHNIQAQDSSNNLGTNQKQNSTIILERAFISSEELQQALYQVKLFQNIDHKNIVTIRQVQNNVIENSKKDKVYIGRVYCDYFQYNLNQAIKERKTTIEAQFQKSNKEQSQKSQHQSNPSQKSILLNQSSTEKKLIIQNCAPHSEKNIYIPTFSEKEIWYMIDALIDGLKFFQERDIIHGDLRPQTIFLTDEGYIKLSLIQCFAKDNSHTNFNITASHIIKGKSLQEIILENNFLLSVEQLVQLKRLGFTNSNLHQVANLTKEILSKWEFNPYKSQVFSLGVLMLQMIFCSSIECCQPLKSNSQNLKRKNVTSQPLLNRQNSQAQINEIKNSVKSQNSQNNYLYIKNEKTKDISINFQLIFELLIVIKSKFSSTLYKILSSCLEINEKARPDCILLYNELKSLDLQTEVSLILDESVEIKQPLQVKYKQSIKGRQRTRSDDHNLSGGIINSLILNERIGHLSPSKNNNISQSKNQNKHSKNISIDIMKCNPSLNQLNNDQIQNSFRQKQNNIPQYSQTVRNSDRGIHLSDKTFLEDQKNNFREQQNNKFQTQNDIINKENNCQNQQKINQIRQKENEIGQNKSQIQIYQKKIIMQEQKENLQKDILNKQDLQQQQKNDQQLSFRQINKQNSAHMNNKSLVKQQDSGQLTKFQFYNQQLSDASSSNKNKSIQKTHQKAFSMNVSVNKDDNSISNRFQITSDHEIQNNVFNTQNKQQIYNKSSQPKSQQNLYKNDNRRQSENLCYDGQNKIYQPQFTPLFSQPYIQTVQIQHTNDVMQRNEQFIFNNQNNPQLKKECSQSLNMKYQNSKQQNESNPNDNSNLNNNSNPYKNKNRFSMNLNNIELSDNIYDKQIYLMNQQENELQFQQTNKQIKSCKQHQSENLIEDDNEYNYNQSHSIQLKSINNYCQIQSSNSFIDNYNGLIQDDINQQNKDFDFQNQQQISLNTDHPLQSTAKFNSETSRHYISESTQEQLKTSIKENDDFKHIYGSPKKVIICSSNIQSTLNKQLNFYQNTSNQSTKQLTKQFIQPLQIDISNNDKQLQNNTIQTLLIVSPSKRVSLNNLNTRTATFNSQKVYISSLLSSQKLNNEQQQQDIQFETDQNFNNNLKLTKDNNQSLSNHIKQHNNQKLSNEDHLNKQDRIYDLNQINQSSYKISQNSYRILQNYNKNIKQDEQNNQISQDQSSIINNQIEINEWKDIESSNISDILQKSFSEGTLINQTNTSIINAVTRKQPKKFQADLSLLTQQSNYTDNNQFKEESTINQLKEQNQQLKQILNFQNKNNLLKQVNQSDINKQSINQIQNIKQQEGYSIHKKHQSVNYTSQNIKLRNPIFSTHQIINQTPYYFNNDLKQKQQETTIQQDQQSTSIQNSSLQSPCQRQSNTLIQKQNDHNNQSALQPVKVLPNNQTMRENSQIIEKNLNYTRTYTSRGQINQSENSQRGIIMNFDQQKKQMGLDQQQKQLFNNSIQSQQKLNFLLQASSNTSQNQLKLKAQKNNKIYKENNTFQLNSPIQMNLKNLNQRDYMFDITPQSQSQQQQKLNLNNIQQQKYLQKYNQNSIISKNQIN